MSWEPMLEQVVREHYPRLVAHALLLVPSRHEAEDLVQDALMSTFSGRARFASAAEAETYVRRAIVSRFVDRVRRRAAETRAFTRVAGRRAQEAEEMPVPGMSSSELELALRRLSPQVRACVVLRHLEDLSVRDTAEVLRLSEGAVKRYVSDGVAALNAALGTRSSQVSVVQTTEGALRRDA